MGRKFILKDEVLLIQNKVDSITSIKSWTKKKFEKRDMFLSFIQEYYRIDHYQPHATFKKTNNTRFYCWDYEIRLIPNNQRGYLRKYRGKNLLIICTYIYKYGNRQLLLIPIKK